MRVLVACERSGVVRRAFRAIGADAWSCDVVPADDGSRFHLQCDAREVLGGWDLIIAHPPCRYLANSGSRWLVERPERRRHLRAAAEFFREMLHAPAARVAVENPIIHKHAAALIGRRQTQVVQPFHHGHRERKATCLWLVNLPPLETTRVMRPPYRQRCWRMPPSADRERLRAITYTGIARAMAQQWGCL